MKGAQGAYDCNKNIGMHSLSVVGSRLQPYGVVLDVLAKLRIPTRCADSLNHDELHHVFPPSFNPTHDSDANLLRQGERLWRLGKAEQFVESVAEFLQMGGSAHFFFTQMQAVHTGLRLARLRVTAGRPQDDWALLSSLGREKCESDSADKPYASGACVSGRGATPSKTSA